MAVVSIVIPCYNAETWIPETLESVRRQTLAEWEAIAVNDGSTDQTLAILQSFALRDPRIRVVDQANSGVCAARNRGYSESDSKSTYLLFLDADDVLHERMLQENVNYLCTNQQYGLVVCDREHIDAQGRVLDQTWEGVDRWVPAGIFARRLGPQEIDTPLASIFMDAVTIPSCVILRREVFERSPRWDEAFGQPFEDSDLFQYITLHNKLAYMPQKLTRYRIHSAQSMANGERAQRQRVKCYAKWRYYMYLLPSEQGRDIHSAFAFRKRLRPQRHLYWAWQESRRGNRRSALQHAVRAARAVVLPFS